MEMVYEQLLLVLKDIGIGAYYGALAALMGYLKSEDLPVSWKAILSKDFWSKFEVSKALKTVLIGLLLGAFTQGKIFMPQVMESLGFNPSDPTFLVVMATIPSLIVYAADQLVKLVVRRTPLVKLWDKLKVSVLKLLQAQEDIVAKAKEIAVVEEPHIEAVPS